MGRNLLVNINLWSVNIVGREGFLCTECQSKLHSEIGTIHPNNVKEEIECYSMWQIKDTIKMQIHDIIWMLPNRWDTNPNAFFFT